MFAVVLRKVETTFSYFQTQFPSLTAKPHTTSKFQANIAILTYNKSEQQSLT